MYLGWNMFIQFVITNVVGGVKAMMPVEIMDNVGCAPQCHVQLHLNENYGRHQLLIHVGLVPVGYPEQGTLMGEPMKHISLDQP